MVLKSYRLENDTLAFRLYGTAKPSYIGFLGPRSRTERIFNEVVKIDPADLESIQDVIHDPIGLDLGAETAEKVAISFGFGKYYGGPVPFVRSIRACQCNLSLNKHRGVSDNERST